MPNTTDPQYQFYDTQTVFNVDIDDLYNRFITPIENLRSHYNALTPNSQELNTPQYQESRCSAFYRMIGFPVVASDGSGFYSPGYDPTLNTDATTMSSYQQIAAKATGFATQIYTRETKEQIVYNAVWAAGGVNATAVCIGSMFLRSFDKQFSDDDSIGPLDNDPTQIQTVSARITEINRFFGSSTSTYPSRLANINKSLLRSVHIIKPFTVSSSIDIGVIPKANRIAAPFLIDKSQLQMFDPQTGPVVAVKRPFIENVISIRFAASNANINSQPLIDSITNQIKSDGTTTDQDLITAISNMNSLNVVSLSAFSNYLNVIRALVRVLIDATKTLGQIRNTINWQPSPDVNVGPEAGNSASASINAAAPGDPNNNNTTRKIELQIIQIMQQQILAQVMNAGLNDTPDPGNFAFSNIDDIIFGGMGQSAKTSYDDQLKQLTDYREKLGNDGLYLLKVIEVIMGEFSGLGLLDILAIQASLWIVSPSALVSLIDQRAYTRLLLRKDINAPSGGLGIVSALTQYETIVKQMYKLIGSYIDVYTTQGNFTDIQNQ